MLIALLTGIDNINAQTVYSIDASNIQNATIKSGHLKMGNPGPKGRKVEVNNRYMTLNGKPIIPVMGEMHFSRVARDQWEDMILKMKACGITIIASYVIWIHHKEVEGQFEWSGDKNLKAFAALCKKHDLWFYPRIGPWIHAEVRKGGTPDWLLAKEGVKERSMNPVFQRYAEEWYKQVALQLKGLMYKDGGPVIGVQLENEYAYGKSGEPYIMWLKQTALKYGIDVPMYTVTGWGNGSVPPYEVIPLWGPTPMSHGQLHSPELQPGKISGSHRSRMTIKSETRFGKARRLILITAPTPILTVRWEYNFALDNVLLKYGTVRPLCRLTGNGLQQWVFVQDVCIVPELCFSDQHIRSLTTNAGNVEHR